jgi:cardiolipin synthase C
MRQAQRDVVIISPYFVPGPRMMAVYEELLKRKVRIRVLTNSLASNDAPAAHAGYARHRARLLDMGVELYEMHSDPNLIGPGAGSAQSDHKRLEATGSKSYTQSRASLHSKAVIIDQRLSIIGSMNLDLRSQLKNSEVALVIRSGALAQQSVKQVDHTIATAAYRLEKSAGALHWRAPAGAAFKDGRHEPGATAKQRMMVMLLGPFAPDEML